MAELIKLKEKTDDAQKTTKDKSVKAYKENKTILPNEQAPPKKTTHELRALTDKEAAELGF